MVISEKGLKLIKKWEGCPTDKDGMCVAYQDCIGVWTIGYGMIDSDYHYTGIHVKKGMKITKQQAEDLFEKLIINKYCPKVDKYMDDYHFNQNQYDALVSFCYNIGNIDGLTQNGQRGILFISEKFLAYCKAGGKTVKGLLDRRRDEKNLFDTPVEKQGYQGTFPTLPDKTFKVKRNYYQIGDGYTTLTNYQTQVKRVQKLTAWAIGQSVYQDGHYGKKTMEAVQNLQKQAGIPVNGKFGKLCLEYCKNLKK